MKSTNFIKLKMDIFSFNELTIDEIVILSFILSHLDNNQDFYYTDNQLVEIFNNKFGIRTIKRILSSLDKKGFIQRINSNIKYDNHMWGNRRSILLGEKLNPNYIKTDEVTTNTPSKIKVSKIKEKVDNNKTTTSTKNIDSNDTKTDKVTTNTLLDIKLRENKEKEVKSPSSTEVKEDKYDMSSWINEIVEEELNKLTI
jgi:hypothetical protein